eukprot:12639160-Alexandrium_andersonii.AAC.1
MASLCYATAEDGGQEQLEGVRPSLQTVAETGVLSVVVFHEGGSRGMRSPGGWAQKDGRLPALGPRRHGRLPGSFGRLQEAHRNCA